MRWNRGNGLTKVVVVLKFRLFLSLGFHHRRAHDPFLQHHRTQRFAQIGPVGNPLGHDVTSPGHRLFRAGYTFFRIDQTRS